MRSLIVIIFLTYSGLAHCEIVKLDYIVKEKETLPRIFKKFLKKDRRIKSTDIGVRQTIKYNEHIENWGALQEDTVITLYFEESDLNQNSALAYTDSVSAKVYSLKRDLALDQLVFKPLFGRIIFGFYYKISLDSFEETNRFGTIDFFSSSPFGIGIEATYYQGEKNSFLGNFVSETSPLRYSIDMNMYQVLRVENVDAAFDYTINLSAAKYHLLNNFSLILGTEFSQLNTVGSVLKTTVKSEIREHKVLLWETGTEYDFQIRQYDIIFQFLFAKSLSNSYTFSDTGSTGEADGMRLKFVTELNYINRLFGKIELDRFTHTDKTSIDQFDSTILRVLFKAGLRF
ncbi:MAG: hypothetical protein H6622_16440 [Halobacteriovoraceae bacterium]|nr:hypothetical protein [Halobacteriovoraceae bacterium]